MSACIMTNRRRNDLWHVEKIPRLHRKIHADVGREVSFPGEKNHCKEDKLSYSSKISYPIFLGVYRTLSIFLRNSNV